MFSVEANINDVTITTKNLWECQKVLASLQVAITTLIETGSGQEDLKKII